MIGASDVMPSVVDKWVDVVMCPGRFAAGANDLKVSEKLGTADSSHPNPRRLVINLRRRRERA